ncbi:Lon protease C-terminal proteolytic domain-containing protein [Mrakia frigida]|uniref:ATP-dependent Lon protease PIM1 n=1 Tax=Mrakia frigida TaxID=29902 RepID=UPI003FCBEE3E
MLPRSSRLVFASTTSRSSSSSSLLRLATSIGRLPTSTVHSSSTSFLPLTSSRSFSSRTPLLSAKRSWENPVSKEGEGEGEGEETSAAAEGEEGAIESKEAQGKEEQEVVEGASKKKAKKSKKPTPQAAVVEGDAQSSIPATEESSTDKAALPENYFVKNSVEEGAEDVASSAATPKEDSPTTESASESTTTTTPPTSSTTPPTPPKSSSPPSQGRKLSSRLPSSSSSGPTPPHPRNTTTSNSDLAGSSKAEQAEEAARLIEMKEILILPVGMLVLPPFKKNFNVKNPEVIAAIRGLVGRKQPYLGVFLFVPTSSSLPPSDLLVPSFALPFTNVLPFLRFLQRHSYKGEDADTIASTSEIHSTGLLCKIDSFLPVDSKDPSGRWTLTIEPKHRIRIDELLQSGKEVVVAAPEFVEEAVKTEGEVVESSSASAEAEAEEVTSFEKIEENEAAAPVEPLTPLEFLQTHAVSIASISHFIPKATSLTKDTLKFRYQATVGLFKELVGMSPTHHESVLRIRSTMPLHASFTESEPDLSVDMMAAICETATAEELQTVVDAIDLEDRLLAVVDLLRKDIGTIEVKQAITQNVRSSMEQRQKEMILHEQMRVIKKELGTDGASQKEDVISKFREAAAKLNMPEEAKKVFDSEINKLATMESTGSEYSVLRNYLEWITSIPWGIHTVDSFSIPSSTTILDADHYGLQTVKDRILEFLAVGKLRGTVQGKIICFVGPPGVGKTSIAKSIARALERKFYRISVGGLRDVAEIKGHRRTYVGALPGKPIQALKITGSENPVILIDEIDKVSGGGGGWGGDPLSALLELLDPEQNSSFSDHYLDIPVDLSKVLFVCTANTLSTIPAPLLDRMEVIEISGYVSAEKQVIASRYLSPQAKKASGLETADVVIDESAVDELIQFYCRESGVRNLKKKIEQIYRKAAYNIVTDVESKAPAEAAVEHHPVEVLPGIPEPPLNHLGDVPPPAIPESASTTASSATPPTTSASSSSPADKSVFPNPFADLPPPPATVEPIPPPSSATPSSLPSGSSTLQAVKPMDIPAGVSLRITSENLKDYVGPAPHQKDRIYSSAPPPGVSNGLGYTGNGAGALMPIEVSVMPGKGAIQTTGKLGDVINESIKIAVSYLRANAFALGITSKETDIILGGSSDQDIHLHMPEGGIGKDGPSAGSAILVALVSLLTKTRVDPDIAMTGEITLNGQVLPVGGLKEKILAAHRASIKKLIVPLGVKSDIEANVPDSVKEGIQIVYVSNVREVLYEVFGTLPIADRWKDGKYPLELLDLYTLPGPTEGGSSTLEA